MSQYIGKEKVTTITEDGDEKIVLLKSGETIRLSKNLFDKVVTKAPVEHNGTAKELKMMTVADELAILLTDVYMLRYSEVETLLHFLQTVTDNNYSYATRLLWGKINPLAGKLGKRGVSLKDVNTVLKEDPKLAEEIKQMAQADAAANREIQRGGPAR